MPMGEPKCGLCGSDLMAGMFHHCKPACHHMVGERLGTALMVVPLATAEENIKLRAEVDALELQLSEWKDKFQSLQDSSNKTWERWDLELKESNRLNAVLRNSLRYVAENASFCNGGCCALPPGTECTGCHAIRICQEQGIIQPPPQYLMHQLKCPRLTSKDATCSCDPIIMKRQTEKRNHDHVCNDCRKRWTCDDDVCGEMPVKACRNCGRNSY